MLGWVQKASQRKEPLHWGVKNWSGFVKADWGCEWHSVQKELQAHWQGGRKQQGTLEEAQGNMPECRVRKWWGCDGNVSLGKLWKNLYVRLRILSYRWWGTVKRSLQRHDQIFVLKTHPTSNVKRVKVVSFLLCVFDLNQSVER